MSTATSATTRTAQCEACGMSFNGEKGVTLHLASSTICPKSAKYDAEVAKEKDTKCTHCGLPCRGEKGLETHLRRSNTCPGGRKALTPKVEKAEKKERKTEKKTEKKEDKPTEKKDEERTVRGRGSSRGGRGSARGGRGSARGGRGSGRGGRATGAKRDEKPVAEKRTTEKKTAEKTEKKPVEKKTAEKNVEKKTVEKKTVEKKVGDTPCPDCKKLFVGETGLKAHKARSFCGKTEEEKATITKERAAKKTEGGEKKVAAKKTEKKPVEKKPVVEYKEVTCEGCSGKFNERSIVAHQTNSTICPKSAKYNKDSAAAAEASKKEAEIPKDTECKSCKSLHRGEKALAIHLAKSTTCPASAKYVKSE